LLSLQQILTLLLFITTGTVKGQSKTCINGYACTGPQQFKYCGEDADGQEEGPLKCARLGGEQTVCFGGEVGYGAANDEGGPCLRKPECSKVGSFGVANGKG